MERLHAFPVDRENLGPSTIKIPRRLLAENKVVGIFPSGTRTSEETPLKRGAVTIASHSKVPIVPVAYVGPNTVGDLVKRKKPRIIYGVPIIYKDNQPKKEAMEIMMEERNRELKHLRNELESVAEQI
ncbi:1-acyl-sn-glycerol-3-phosphate acyltransferase [Virgibacillus natechei]|uniref:1-acyl-sn-glycerol-3-phosphate acyltransferase n=1 Tax=Virgibacillus natechei TaxID=1216297 RepID=A0ABS4IBQ9_9BACI|nr:lysophospholipid acyltransferase family protein [Virgibacillus natechei]MBP1968338.1 1-acyl-sn-glycerol-3-phosphate acyltransferase [Virgibacillus natechei]UZD13472.1 1-acyl-sn-glycerol-3-phosphate acyltransferase [Virgibacillus natechei]